MWRYSTAAGGRGPKRSSPAAIEVKIDAVAEPMFAPIVGASPRDLRGKAFHFGIHGNFRHIHAAELALVSSRKFVSDLRPHSHRRGFPAGVFRPGPAM